MSTTQSAQQQAEELSDAVAEALEVHKQVAEDIKGVAEELGVVHAVLDNRIPDDARHDDVGDAIARTDELEKRLNESVKILEDATEVLEQEVKANQALNSSASPTAPLRII